MVKAGLEEPCSFKGGKSSLDMFVAVASLAAAVDDGRIHYLFWGFWVAYNELLKVGNAPFMKIALLNFWMVVFHLKNSSYL